MSISLAGKLGALVVASFVVHTALLVNSVESELWREQGQEGLLLTQQLADAGAPLALSHDMVSLSVLTARFDDRPGIQSVRIFDARNQPIGQAGPGPADSGRQFSAPMVLQGQPLGHVDLQLTAPARGDILRRSAGNIALSALIHAALFGLVWLGGRASNATQTPPRRHAQVNTTAAPTPVPEPIAPAPVAAEPVALLHLSLDDPNALLTRVNASTADDLLTVLDHLLDRAARLYGGEVSAPFSPTGTVVCFHQGKTTDWAFQAMLCGQLFLELAFGAEEQRRAAGLFNLPVKAGLHLAPGDDGESRQIAATLARTAPSGRLLSSTELLDPAALARCRPGQTLSLALEAGRELPIVVIDKLLPEYQLLIHNQTQQLLGLANNS